MEEITDNIEDRLNDIGISLSEIESLSRIIQACLEDDSNLEAWDIQTILEVVKSKVINANENFNEIAVMLKI